MSGLNRFGTVGPISAHLIPSPGESLFLAATTTEEQFAAMTTNYLYVLTALDDVYVKQGTLADITWTGTHGTDTLNAAAHGMTTGDGPYRLKNTGGALPAELAVDTDYWIIVTASGTFKLAASYADAVNVVPVPVAFGDNGTGTHKLRRVFATVGAGSMLVNRGLPLPIDAGLGLYLSVIAATGGNATLQRMTILR